LRSLAEIVTTTNKKKVKNHYSKSLATTVNETMRLKSNPKVYRLFLEQARTCTSLQGIL